MKICTLLPSFSGFTKIVSSASPRFRFSMEDAGVIRSLPSLVQPWVLEIRGQFGADVFHVRLTLKIKLFNKLVVLDVGRIFREGQVLDAELIRRRLGRGFFAQLSRRR